MMHLVNSAIKSLTIPKIIKKMSKNFIKNCGKVDTIEFLGDEIIFGDEIPFVNTLDFNLKLISFLNAKKVDIIDIKLGKTHIIMISAKAEIKYINTRLRSYDPYVSCNVA